MTKYLLIAIRSEWLYLILIGKKLIELRKVIPNRVKDEIAKGNTVKCLFYCTKRKPNLYIYELGDKNTINLDYGGIVLNGKIVCEFDLRKLEKFEYIFNETLGSVFKSEDNYCFEDYTKNWLEEKSCIDFAEIIDYSWNKKYGKEEKYKDILALNIDNLTIFDEPKELGEFCHHDDVPNCPYTISQYLKRPPQNCCCVYGE